MNTTCESRVKTSLNQRAHEEFKKLLAAAEASGFYGTATLILVVQNGHIEQVKVATERQVK